MALNYKDTAVISGNLWTAESWKKRAGGESCPMPFPKAWTAFLRERQGSSLWPTIGCFNTMCLRILSWISELLWESRKKLFASNNKKKLWNHKKCLKFENFFPEHFQINFFPLKATGIHPVTPMPNCPFSIFITHMSTVF